MTQSKRTAAWVVCRNPGGVAVLPRAQFDVRRAEFISSHRTKAAAQTAAAAAKRGA